MSVDPKIIEAIESAVELHGQDKSLTSKIVAWLENLAAGNEELSDKASVDRYLDVLYGATNEKKSKGTLL